MEKKEAEWTEEGKTKRKEGKRINRSDQPYLPSLGLDTMQNDSSTSSRVRAVILSSEMKRQLRSIIPRISSQSSRHAQRSLLSIHAGYVNGYIRERDIIYTVKGFVAACCGLSTGQVLKMNFRDEIEIILGQSGIEWFCLLEKGDGAMALGFTDPQPQRINNTSREPAAFAIDRLGERQKYDRMEENKTNTSPAIPDRVISQSVVSEDSNPKSILKHPSSNGCGIIKQEPTESESVGGKDQSNVANNSSEKKQDDRNNIAIIDRLDDRDISEKLNDIQMAKASLEKTNIELANMTNTYNSVRDQSTSTPNEHRGRGRGISNQPAWMTNAQQLSNIAPAMDGETSSGKAITDGPVCKYSFSQTAPSIDGETLNSATKEQVPSSTLPSISSTVQANVLKLVQKEREIDMSQLKEIYHERFGTPFSHEGKLKKWLVQVPGICVGPIKGPGTKGRKKQDFVKLQKNISPEKKTVNGTIAKEVSDTATTSSTDGTASQKKISASHTHKLQNILKLTDEQSQTCTKFPPGCRVVYDYRSHGLVAAIRMGVVASVSINLSGERRLKHEIKLNRGNTMIDEEDLLYAPQCSVYYQPYKKGEESEQPAIVLSCQKNVDGGSYSYCILISKNDGEVSHIVQDVSLDQLTYRETACNDASESIQNLKKRPNASGYGEGEGDSPRALKKAKTLAAGEILHYHQTIRSKWEQLCTKWGTVPSVKDVVALSPNPSNSNKPMSFFEFRDQVVGGGLCVVGQVKGTCTFPGCTYNHRDKISVKRAKRVCKILDNAMTVKQGPVKKEKPPS